jgi:Sulfotransferase domain
MTPEGPETRSLSGPGPGARPLGLVYVAGAHRSGGTPLGAVLGGHPTIFYAGELYRFPHPIFDRPDPARKCSCGASVVECPFWSRVRVRLENEVGPLPQLRREQARFESWRFLPVTLWRRYRHQRELRQHVEKMGRFLRILAEESGARTIVETSYNPMRGLLYRDPASGVEVSYLHLVRDGRSFIASERTASDPPEVPWRWLRTTPVVVGRWVSYHVLSLLLLAHQRRYLRVRYEDLLRDPGETVGRIARFLELDLSDVVERVERGIPIPMHHIAAGNRVRLLGEIRIDSEGGGVPRLGLGSRALFWGLAGGLALALGYRPLRTTQRRAPAARYAEPAPAARPVTTDTPRP